MRKKQAKKTKIPLIKKRASTTKMKLTKKQEMNLRVKDIPVTVAHLDEFKKEVNSKITTVELIVKNLERKMNAQFSKVDARFNEMEARFAKIDARFNEIEARFAKIDARFNEMEARFALVDARFDKIESRLNEIEARFIKIDEKLEKMMEIIHRSAVKMEEQATRNNIVLDHLNALFSRQDQFESQTNEKLKNIETAIKGT